MPLRILTLVSLFLLNISFISVLSADASKKEERYPSLDKVTKEAKKIAGFFNLYKKDKKLYLEIPKASFQQEFFFFSSLSGGKLFYMMPVWTMDQEVVYFKQVDDTIILYAKDISETAKKDSPESIAVSRAFLDRQLYQFSIEGAAKGESAYLIPFHEFLYSMGQNNIPSWAAQFSGISGVDEYKSFINSIKAFPENLEIEVQQTLRVQNNWANQVRFHYSFVKKNKSNYRPRIADERIGYFTAKVRDWSNLLEDDGIKNYVMRWPLEKADKNAEYSVVKKPIVYHIDKTVPFEYRSYIREGVLEWNKAFEKLGYIGAIEARLPESGLNFDPADSRFSTISWATDKAVLAYGPARFNPETGEIIDADIVFGAFWLSTINFEADLYGKGSFKLADLDQDTLNRANFLQSFSRYHDSLFISQANIDYFLLNKQAASGLDQKDYLIWKSKFIGEYLKDLAMHEVGHTLGLRHNFKASSKVKSTDLLNKDFLKDNQISTSVMDYNDLNVRFNETPEMMTSLGEYDYLAIEYGYKDLSPKEELKELNKIAESLVSKGLDYGSDEDLYGLDPHINAYDLGDDLIATAKNRLTFAQETLKSLEKQFITTNSRFDSLMRAINSLLFDYMQKSITVSRYIGGVYQNRDRQGDKDQRNANVAVSYERQALAMEYLRDYVFSDKFTLEIPKNLIEKARINPWNWFQANYVSGYYSKQLELREAIIYNLLSRRTLHNLKEFHEKVLDKPFSRKDLFQSLYDMILKDIKTMSEDISEIKIFAQKALVVRLVELISDPYGDLDKESYLYATHILRLTKEDCEARLKSLVKSRDFNKALLEGHLKDLNSIVDSIFDAKFVKKVF